MTEGVGDESPAAHFARATAMMNLGRWPEALAGYDAVLRQEPGHVPSLNNRGIVLSRLGRHAEALAGFEAALAMDPGDTFALNNRGEELQKLSRPHEALASYDAAIAKAPGSAEAHGNRGYLLGQLGRNDEAVTALECAVALEPSNPRFYQHLAPLRRFSPGDPILVRMQALAARPADLSTNGRIELGFALAKALGDTGEHEAAFGQLALANRLKRATFQYDQSAALDELERIGRLFGEDFQARMAGAGDPDPTPILVVGMPRSGSTLVEQILASHPGAFGAGERTDLDDAIDRALQGPRGFPEAAARLSRQELQGIGADYVRSLRALAPEASRIVDKTLSNFRHLGLVHAALPNARMIHVRRDPVDACMSCYSRLFGGDQPFAYDLVELGRYHRALDRLMRRWREVLPAEALLELDYEALVAEPKAQVRRLLAHCGLDWNPRCLEFHRTERQVRTSSAAQVRQPLYRDAVGASQVYRAHLQPLLDALGDLAPSRMAAPPPHARETSAIEGGTGAMDLKTLESKAASGDVRAQRDLAAALDAEGRHTEAVDWLARAGQAGDAEALTDLGLRLMVGKDAPFLPQDGARLLGNAVGAGGARAMEHFAVLIGGGFYAQQSWPVALDLLQRAAEAGSASAQAQLQLLAGRPAGEGGWAALRQSVDLAAWMRAPEPKVLSESPRILSVSGLITPAVCDWIVGQCAGKLVRAELYDPATGQHAPGTDTRQNRIANFDLAETKLANLMVQARMAAVLGAPMAVLEPFAVLHYQPGEEYGEHVDFLDPAIPAYAAELTQRGQRVATCLIYLNDGFEGGETAFPRLGLSYKGSKGDALIFLSTDASGRPDPRTVHAGRTPTSGEKWLLSQFFRNRPVVGAGGRLA